MWLCYKREWFLKNVEFFIGSYNISDEIKTYENNCVKLCKYESKAHV